MGRPGKSVVYSANVTALGDLAEPTRTVGTKVLDAANTVHDTITSLEWEGVGKDSAVGRADHELAQDKRVVQGYNALADAYQHGSATMAPMIADLKKAAQGLEADSFKVSEDWVVTDTFDYRAGKAAMMALGASEKVATDKMNQVQGERGNEAKTNTVSLQQRADALGQADQDTVAAINKAKGDIGAAAPLAAGLNGDAGKTDLFDAIARSKYTGLPIDPAELSKLVAAGTLSQADLDKLARGEKVEIPAGQMAYLYQMSQSLNGLSPEQIRDLQQTLPADAQAALAQGLKIVSDPNVQVHGADQMKQYAQGATDDTRGSFVPVTGSKVNLPSEMAKELSRTDRVTQGPLINAPGSIQPPTTTLRGVGAMQDIADILKPGAAIPGSEATRSMLEAATQYANADISHHAGAGPVPGDVLNSDHHGYPGTAVGDTGVQKALADIVGVAGTDHLSVHDLTTNPSTSDGFLHAMTQEHWGDKSTEVGDAFRWMGQDPASPINGETANAVAHYLGSHDTDLKGLPGGGTFGQANPGVAQGMADGLKPYLGQLAGLDGPHNGLTQFNNADEMKSMFSILDQDHNAAISINSAGSAQYSNILSGTAEHGLHGDELLVAGRLSGAMHNGALDSDLFNRETAQWQQAVHDKHEDQVVDTWKKALGFIPEADKPLAVAEILKGLGQTPGSNPALIQGDQFMKTLIDSGGATANTSDYYATVLHGLIAHNPAIAHDPALAPFITDNQIDYAKVANTDNQAQRALPTWFENAGQTYFDRTTQSYWKTQLDLGRDNPNWSH